MYGHHEFDLFEAIYTTRSMRRLKPDPVPPGLIVKVIEAATMGPSGHNRQPWFFIVVTEREAKSFVAERYLKAWETVFTPTEREVVANDPQSQRGRNLRSAKYLAEHIADVPVMIFACVKKYTDRARAGQPMWGAIYPAIQNLCLAARSLRPRHVDHRDAYDVREGDRRDARRAARVRQRHPDSDGLPERTMGATRSQACAAGDVLGKMGQPARRRARLSHASRIASTTLR